MPESAVGVFLPLNAVFPAVDASVEELTKQLRRLSRTDALIWCARLNLVVANATRGSRLEQQRFGIQQIFSRPEIQRIAEFYTARNQPESTAVFFRAQLLELARWIAELAVDHPEDGTTFEDPEIRTAFGKAALIVSEMWGHRTYGNAFPAHVSIAEARRRSLDATRLGTTALSAGLAPMLAVARGRILFKDCMSRFRPEFGREFSEASGLQLEEFYTLLTLLSVAYLLQSPEWGGVPEARSGLFHQSAFEQSGSLSDVFRRYAEFAAQTPEELARSLRGTLRTHLSLEKALRRKPLLRTRDGRYIVVDPVVFSEHAATGPLFSILPKKTNSEVNELFKNFGEAFEEYAGQILRRMFSTSSGVLAKRLEIGFAGKNKSGSDVEIADACLNDVADLVLFEMKAVWSPDHLLGKGDPEQYHRKMIAAYARPGEGGERPKGAGQLAAAISSLASGEWTPRYQDIGSVVRVHPVLLAYDARLQSAAHPWLLSEEFRRALDPDEILPNGAMRKGMFRVAALSVLSIDDLELLETSIEHFGFVELLQAYSEVSPERLVGFHDFLASSKYRDCIYANRNMAQSALDALLQVKHLMGWHFDEEEQEQV
ncbi:MAG: hypothetical protein H0T47_21310 [Planctomycetaceae bacterium]|nr:hypothetical protein [Planctomycetaceae bacterium]